MDAEPFRLSNSRLRRMAGNRYIGILNIESRKTSPFSLLEELSAEYYALILTGVTRFSAWKLT